MKYLDYVGLSTFWDEMNPHVIFYGICDTLPSVQNKSVTVEGLSQVTEGTRLIVKFTYKNTEHTPTLTVVSHGNETIMSTVPIIEENGSTISAAGAGKINGYCEFIYNGSGYFVLISNNYSNQIIYSESYVEPAGEEGMIWLKKKST